VIGQLLAGARTEDEIVGPGGVLAQLAKRLVERALQGELSEHLGYEPHREPLDGVGNSRNGSTAKTLAAEHGPVEIRTPRDRKGSFEPQLVRKGQRRFEGFDDKILALYSRGLSTRDIEAHLREVYGVDVGRDLISRVTDAVMGDVREWQQRPLGDVYPVVFLDALVLKIREGGTVQRKAPAASAATDSTPAATDSSTARCTRSSSAAARTTPRPSATSSAKPARARACARRSVASTATSPATSSAYSRQARWRLHTHRSIPKTCPQISSAVEADTTSAAVFVLGCN
jgi:mutator family transposase